MAETGLPRMGNDDLLRVQGLRTWFPIRRGVLSRTRGHVRAVDGVSFAVGHGETLGLVGESGCGKSTLARTLLLLERPCAGELLFAGRDLLTLSPRELGAVRRELQLVFQDPYAALNPRLTVLEALTEGVLAHRMVRPRDRVDAARALLRDVGMNDDALHRYPHEFSGGQRQRLCVARALSLKPRLVVCDEPVSALDVSVQAQVLNLLLDLQAKYGLSYLFISHDLNVVRHIAARTAVMYLGELVEIGPTRDVIASPRHPYSRALISAVPRADGVRGRRVTLRGEVPSPAQPPSGCRFHTRCPFAVDRCWREPPLLAAGGPADTHVVACHRWREV